MARRRAEARAAAPAAPEQRDGHAALAARHLRWGWWSLFVFLSLGIALEALHGFKIAWYLSLANQTRRFMWTLAHAHGTLLALIHLAFAASLRARPLWPQSGLRAASASLVLAGILLPLGFFLGGLDIRSGDPGLGILLVPAGSVLLLAGVFLVARGAGDR
jgi:hypothetical protein